MIKTIKIPRGARVGSDNRPLYGWLEIEADCVGGLCVHKDIGGLPRWRVTHEASGGRIGPLDAKTRLRALSHRDAALALGVDWTQGEEEAFAAARPLVTILIALGDA